MSTEPFVVQCQTCGSSLRVTNPAAIGTIAACPKCNAMVMLQPPDQPGQGTPGQGQVAVGHSSVDSQAITEEGIADQSSSISAAGPDVADPPSQPGGPFIGSPSSGPADEATIADRQPGWESHQAQRSRQIALIATLAISGLLTAAFVFAWFVNAWRDRPQTDLAQQSTVDEATAAVSEPDTGPPESQPSAEEFSAQTPKPPAANEPPTETEPPAESERPAETEPNSVVAADSLPGDSADLPLNATPGELAANNSDIPMDLIRSSPLDDPAGGTEGDDDTGSRLEELPEEFAIYTEYLPTEGQNTRPNNLEPPPSIDQLELDEAAEAEGQWDPQEPKVLNLRRDMEMELAVDARAYPLSDLLLVISQYTGVPIQIDWPSFDLVQQDVAIPIATPDGFKTAWELLGEVSGLVDGEIQQEQTLLVFTVAEARFSEATEALTDLSDFGDGAASAQALIADFVSLEPRDPEADADAGERESAETQNRQQRQIQAIASEALRRMRGIAPKLPDASLERWASPAGGPSLSWPRLTGGPQQPARDTPTSLAELLRRHAQSGDATCLFNWYDLILLGAGPETLVFPHPAGDLATSLDSSLQRWDLHVRQVDTHHWWVGTDATYDRLPVIVWTPPLGESRERFVQRLRSIAPPGGRSERFRFVLDEQSDRALLLLPRYLARQVPKLIEP